MKPRFRRFVSNALPAIIIVPAFINVAPAAVLNVSGLGSIEILSGYTGPDSILADGGTNPTAPLTVTIAESASLTGDDTFNGDEGIRVTASGYTITNSGSVNVTGHGINVREVEDTKIVNTLTGEITGGSDGIRFRANGGRVENSGSITGGGYGVKGQNGFYLKNFFNLAPVDSELETVSEPGLLYTTQVQIKSTNGHSVRAGDDAEIINEGLISSEFSDGINVADNATIKNNYVADETFDESIISGQIKGENNGISAGTDLDLNNQINAEIRGDNGDGVYALENAKIVNSGLIYGLSDGIDIGDSLQNEFAPSVETLLVIDEPVVVPITSTTIDNYGSIIGEDGDGINGASTQEIITNWGSIEGEYYAMTLQDGDDSVTLNAGSSITGDISGGSGYDTLTFNNGARFAFDEASNVVMGSVYGMEMITKNGYGTAIIEDESFDFLDSVDEISPNGIISLPYSTGVVYADQIRVNSGALYINGHVGPSSEMQIGTLDIGPIIEENYFTYIIADGGEIGGTSGNFLPMKPMNTETRVPIWDGPQGWQANITLRNGGGISAGSEPQDLSPSFTNPFPLDSVGTLEEPVFVSPAIGLLMIEGNVTHQIGGIDTKDGYPSEYEYSPTYIRVDINPDSEIDEGYNSDLIVQTGQNSVYDMTGAEVWIAPTNSSGALTNGSYTIIDSQRNIVGFDPETTKIGVVIKNESAPIEEEIGIKGRVEMPAVSFVSYDTVLGNYFSRLYLEEAEEEIVDANATFSSFGIQALEPLPIVSGTNLVLEIDYNFSELPGLTENQSSFGEALDQFIEQPEGFEDPALTELLEDLANQDLPTAQAALATLDPSSSFSVVQSAVNSNYRLHRLTQNHLAAVRGGSQTSSEVGASSKDAKGGMTAGTVTTTTTGRGNVWGTMSYDDQDFDGNLSEADFDGDIGSFTAGVDWLVAPQLILGLVFDGSKADLDGDGSNSTDIDSFRAAAYGTWGGAMGFYSDFLVGYGSHDFDNTKSFDLFGDLSSDTDASSLQAMWTVGYTMGDEKIKHGPFAGFEYQKVDVDGYTQGGIVPIEVDDYDVDSFRGLIGYRVDATLGKFSPYAAVAYAHEFEDGSNTASATVGGSPFTVEGGEQSSAFLISVGTGYALTNALTVDFGYRGEIATDDGITSHGVSLGLNYSF